MSKPTKSPREQIAEIRATFARGDAARSALLDSELETLRAQRAAEAILALEAEMSGGTK